MKYFSRSRRLTSTLLLASATALLSPGGLPAQDKPAAKASPAKANATNEWKDLFNGKSLAGWKPSTFASQGEVKVGAPGKETRSAILLELSDNLSGITLTNVADLPQMNYEVSLEAMKLDGSDFFCGLTFPVGKTAASFIVGGWGGAVVGISSIDGADASENETTKFMKFERNKWHRIRVKVTPAKIEAWIDDEKMVDVETTGHKIGLRFGEIENSLPFGIAAYQTRAALRDIRLRRL
jgi:hypothetical protein